MKRCFGSAGLPSIFFIFFAAEKKPYQQWPKTLLTTALCNSGWTWSRQSELELPSPLQKTTIAGWRDITVTRRILKELRRTTTTPSERNLATDQPSGRSERIAEAKNKRKQIRNRLTKKRQRLHFLFVV